MERIARVGSKGQRKQVMFYLRALDTWPLFFYSFYFSFFHHQGTEDRAVLFQETNKSAITSHRCQATSESLRMAAQEVRECYAMAFSLV